MTLSEHDKTEIVNVSLTAWEARNIIDAIKHYLAPFGPDSRDHVALTLRSIELVLENQVDKWAMMRRAHAREVEGVCPSCGGRMINGTCNARCDDKD